MPCVTCKLVNCQSGKDITLFSLQDALFFNGVPLSFIVDCPDGFYCPPGTFPRTVTYPPGTFQIPHPPNPPPGQPIILQLMGCQSLVQRILTAGSSAAAIQSAANEIIQEVAAQQAQCDTNPATPPDPNNPPGPQPPRPPPSGGGTLPPNNPTSPFMNQEVRCNLERCPGDLILTLVKSFPSWITFIQDVGIGIGQLRGRAGVFGGPNQAAANATAQGILNSLCETAFSANYVVCAGGGGGCAIFDVLSWGAPTYVDGGVQTVSGSWLAANFSFSIQAPVPNTLASASNSASAALTLATPVIAYLDVTWVSDPGNGALEFNISVDTLLLGNVFTVDQSTNLPAWNLTSRYEALILATTADTLLVSVAGSINDSVARTASISAMLTCVSAFGNVEKTAHVDCPFGQTGPGGNATVAANTIYKASQAEADAAAQAQADQEAADDALDPLNCCSGSPTPSVWTITIDDDSGLYVVSANGINLSGAFDMKGGFGIAHHDPRVFFHCEWCDIAGKTLLVTCNMSWNVQGACVPNPWDDDAELRLEVGANGMADPVTGLREFPWPAGTANPQIGSTSGYMSVATVDGVNSFDVRIFFNANGGFGCGFDPPNYKTHISGTVTVSIM